MQFLHVSPFSPLAHGPVESCSLPQIELELTAIYGKRTERVRQNTGQWYRKPLIKGLSIEVLRLTFFFPQMHFTGGESLEDVRMDRTIADQSGGRFWLSKWPYGGKSKDILHPEFVVDPFWQTSKAPQHRFWMAQQILARRSDRKNFTMLGYTWASELLVVHSYTSLLPLPCWRCSSWC